MNQTTLQNTDIQGEFDYSDMCKKTLKIHPNFSLCILKVKQKFYAKYIYTTTNILSKQKWICSLYEFLKH